jgi:hypothetical protein
MNRHANAKRPGCLCQLFTLSLIRHALIDKDRKTASERDRFEQDLLALAVELGG